MRRQQRDEVIGKLILRLHDEQSFVREEAARRLGRFRGDQIVGALIEALRDEDHLVRLQAVLGLRRIGDPAALLPLYDASQESGFLDATFAALRHIGMRSFGYLEGAVESADLDTARRAIGALACLPDTRAVPLIIRTGLNRGTQVMREVGDALKDWQAAVTVFRSDGDQSILDDLTSLLLGEDTRAAAHAALELVFLQDRRGLKAVCALLDDADSEVRADAAYALGCYRSEDAIAPLVHALADVAAEVRFESAIALGRLAVRAWDAPQLDMTLASGPLDSAAHYDPSPCVRGEAVYALGCAVRPLVRAIVSVLEHDEVPSVRAEAARAFGVRNPDDGLQPLIAALGDPVAEVRIAAAASLDSYRDHRAARPLRELILDDDPNVRRVAYEAWLECRRT